VIAQKTHLTIVRCVFCSVRIYKFFDSR